MVHTLSWLLPLPIFGLHRLRLPSYIMDFGTVVMGTVARRVVRAINTGHEQITFRFEPSSLAKISRMGFSPNISQIRQLPGSPHCDFVDWELCFDPKAANLPLGRVSTELLIAVSVLLVAASFTISLLNG